MNSAWSDAVELKPRHESADLGRSLDFLSKRVRALRAHRGMTRKELSRQSNISERYLAQLEGGGANPSLALLLRVAGALDVDVHELLPYALNTDYLMTPLLKVLRQLSPQEEEAAYQLLVRHFPRYHGPFHGVALVGQDGAGKSTLGVLLAERFGLPFIRLAEVVEEMGGMRVDEYMAVHGEKAYRRLERHAVRHVLKEHSRAVVEAGAILAAKSASYELLRRGYYTVWIRASVAEHVNRVAARGNARSSQGLATAMDDMRRTLAEREPYYRTASAVLDTSGRDIHQCLLELVELTTPHLVRESD
ncbi:MAG: shikimate kinase [Aquisalimonadaceae bacterium]